MFKLNKEYEPKYKVGDKVILTNTHPGRDKRGSQGYNIIGKEVIITKSFDGFNKSCCRAYYYIKEASMLIIREPEIIGLVKTK